jgi:hypothetical protein
MTWLLPAKGETASGPAQRRGQCRGALRDLDEGVWLRTLPAFGRLQFNARRRRRDALDKRLATMLKRNPRR